MPRTETAPTQTSTGAALWLSGFAATWSALVAIAAIDVTADVAGNPVGQVAASGAIALAVAFLVCLWAAAYHSWRPERTVDAR